MYHVMGQGRLFDEFGEQKADVESKMRTLPIRVLRVEFDSPGSAEGAYQVCDCAACGSPDHSSMVYIVVHPSTSCHPVSVISINHHLLDCAGPGSEALWGPPKQRGCQAGLLDCQS